MRRLTSLQERATGTVSGAGLGNKTFHTADAAWESLAKIDDALTEIPRHDPPHPHAEDVKSLNKAVRKAMMALEDLRAVAARSPLQ